jgi:hypothetical protein
MGAFIRATKPTAVVAEANTAPAESARACCGPECCA